MRRVDPRAQRELLPLLAISAVVVLVAFGFGRGLWIANLHNGLLAVAFTLVGAYISIQRPGHREGTLFLATGFLETALFVGRQIGHDPSGRADDWLGWFGVWPLALALALATLAIISYPDGRLPSPRWRPVVVVIVGVAVICSGLSALWPVEYRSSGVLTSHPLTATTPSFVRHLWSGLAHPAYAAFQVLWLVAVVSRWRTADPRTRRQLQWPAGAAAVSAFALLVGLVVAGTHVPGVLAAMLVPLAGGWAIVHQQHVTAYAALSWLSRAGATTEDLPTAIATTTAEALSAPGATLWMGSPDALHAVGIFPPTDSDIPSATWAELVAAGGEAREVLHDGEVVGALSVRPRPAGALTVAERRLLDDLTAQAAWVIEHVGLARVVVHERAAGHLVHLTPRENDVLELMASGLTNQAICDELHLSIKTVEPIVGTIFQKLDLDPDRTSNRRVLAVLAFVRAQRDSVARP